MFLKFCLSFALPFQRSNSTPFRRIVSEDVYVEEKFRDNTFEGKVRYSLLFLALLWWIVQMFLSVRSSLLIWHCSIVPLFCCLQKSTVNQDWGRKANDILKHTKGQLQFSVKEEIFVGEKFRTFPSKTFCMELNFVLSNWPKTGKQEKKIERPVNHAEEILVWKIISYIFELYESYEIKFPMKISFFTVAFGCV